jgi:hypothetical protein
MRHQRGATAIHASPWATTIPSGRKPSLIVAITRFVRGSILDSTPGPAGTPGSPWYVPLVTQMEPAPVAIRRAVAGTGTCATILSVCGSIRQTVLRGCQTAPRGCGVVTQIAPAPAASRVGSPGTGMRAATSPRSMRATSPRRGSATHAAP